MTPAQTALIIAMTVTQFVTLGFLLTARYEARLYRRLYDRLAGSCVRRDPKTGRYLKTRSN